MPFFLLGLLGGGLSGAGLYSVFGGLGIAGGGTAFSVGLGTYFGLGAAVGGSVGLAYEMGRESAMDSVRLQVRNQIITLLRDKEGHCPPWAQVLKLENQVLSNLGLI